MVYITEKFGKQNETASKPNHSIITSQFKTISISILPIQFRFNSNQCQLWLQINSILHSPSINSISIYIDLELDFSKYQFITLNKIILQYSNLNPNFKYDSIPSSISK